MKKIFLLLFLLFTGVSLIDAQPVSVSVGGSLGLGQMKGNTPSLTAMNGALFIDVAPEFTSGIIIRAGYLYERKVEYFLPENRDGRYYPAIRVFSLKMVLDQSINEKFYIEEGMGPILLNDRTLFDNTKWDAGAGFNALIGADLRNGKAKGTRIGLGVDYGISFTNTNASYSNIYVQMQYYIL